MRGPERRVRGLAAKQIAYTLTQVPLVYFHIMSLTLHAWLGVSSWEAARATVDHWGRPCAVVEEGGHQHAECYGGAAVCACAAQVLVTYLFVGLYTSAVWMSDPMGTRASNYDLSHDLDNLWREALNAIHLMATGASEPPASEFEATDAGFAVECKGGRPAPLHPRIRRRSTIF